MEDTTRNSLHLKPSCRVKKSEHESGCFGIHYPQPVNERDVHLVNTQMIITCHGRLMEKGTKVIKVLECGKI